MQNPIDIMTTKEENEPSARQTPDIPSTEPRINRCTKEPLFLIPPQAVQQGICPSFKLGRFFPFLILLTIPKNVSKSGYATTKRSEPMPTSLFSAERIPIMRIEITKPMSCPPKLPRESLFLLKYP